MRHRHEWVRVIYEPGCPWCGSFLGEHEHCRLITCRKFRDEAASRRNHNNRQRGNRTSHDLAAYLPNGRNVEALKLPWDVEAPGCRIQSKRLVDKPSRNEIVRLLTRPDWPPSTVELRVLYWVAPRARITSGLCYALLREWVAWHGWMLPAGAALVTAGEGLIELPLPTFRDLHIGEKP